MKLDPPADTQSGERFDCAFRSRGGSRELTSTVSAKLMDTPSMWSLTDAEGKFATAAGVPTEIVDRGSAALQSDAQKDRDDGLQGPTYTTTQVAERLLRSPASVRRMRANGNLYAAGRTGQETAYPAWQFTDSGVLPHLSQIVAAFPSGYHPRDIDVVMSSPMEELHGHSPREWIEAEGELALLLTLLRELSL
ncbi:hypothetical protein M4D51_02920 [Microbacterium sp. p3-SID338]|uniref:hypothetical protein n=1 Tax=Microbacterium sp. p3-SID338 TaxID=2916214 RepID=UPI0021A6AE6D|nr:hypothetical protein [Microbacterium sp. p3-SID338]MCT1394672.1 hypothetical protein [Microbacterium sp. p3-SID338]